MIRMEADPKMTNAARQVETTLNFLISARSIFRNLPNVDTEKPVAVFAGAPNVGKSSLYNYLTKTRDAIVADMPGLTRDRHYGKLSIADHDFILVDTGGFEPDSTIFFI